MSRAESAGSVTGEHQHAGGHRTAHGFALLQSQAESVGNISGVEPRSAYGSANLPSRNMTGGHRPARGFVLCESRAESDDDVAEEHRSAHGFAILASWNIARASASSRLRTT
jgi:hypothetical protein